MRSSKGGREVRERMGSTARGGHKPAQSQQCLAAQGRVRDAFGRLEDGRGAEQIIHVLEHCATEGVPVVRVFQGLQFSLCVSWSAVRGNRDRINLDPCDTVILWRSDHPTLSPLPGAGLVGRPEQPRPEARIRSQAPISPGPAIIFAA